MRAGPDPGPARMFEGAGGGTPIRTTVIPGRRGGGGLLSLSPYVRRFCCRSSQSSVRTLSSHYADASGNRGSAFARAPQGVLSAAPSALKAKPLICFEVEVMPSQPPAKGLHFWFLGLGRAQERNRFHRCLGGHVYDYGCSPHPPIPP